MKRTFVDKLETWLVVTLITVLVWLYAEGAIVERHPRETVTVEFVAAGGSSMRIEPEFAQTFVTFRSSSPVYQRFQAATTNRPIEIEVEPGVGASAGLPQTIDLRGRLEASLFNELGVAIDDIDPALVPVVAQRVVTRTVPLVVRDAGLDLRNPPAVEPATVVISLPESQALELDALVALDPMAVAAGVDLARAVQDNPPIAGQPQVSTLAIEPPTIAGRVVPVSALRITEADVSYTLANREGTLDLTSVPLRQVTPLQFPFTIQVAGNAQVLDDVALRGPLDVLEQIESGEMAVWAELHFFDATALTAGEMTVPVVFRLPAGVTSETLPQVNVTLTQREGSTP